MSDLRSERYRIQFYEWTLNSYKNSEELIHRIEYDNVKILDRSSDFKKT